MARVTGIGGVFLRTPDPKRLTAWYEKHLGLKPTDFGIMLQYDDDIAAQPKGTSMTVWSPFPQHTEYFGPDNQAVMINYRVDDIDAIVDALTEAGEWVDPKRMDESYGRFAWAKDCDGNRIELWQPLGD
ncbi:VOC family protein [Granulicella cerasi]|uniref:VOC family protein n=1 Tax=Granulicella cerasi TaxID=741063 RepID=A0ABW1ZBK3_9BACT|nr:VOC family protein [Granulicella cerasi]